MTSYARPAASLIQCSRQAVVPFVLAAILAWAAAGGASVDPPRYFGAGLMILVAGAAGVAAVPHERWTRLGVLPSAIGLVLALALLRTAVHGPWPGATEVGMIPVLLAALNSRSQRHLSFVLAAVAVVSVPALPPSSVLSHAWVPFSGPLLFLAISAITAFAIQSLMNDVRNSAAEATKQACTDPLTGLPNRRAWERHLHQTPERRQITVAILDLDEFKQFNDANGHPAGDRLLTQAAAGWRDALPVGDFIARIGGEEFGVLLPDTDSAGAVEVIQRLRSHVPSGRSCSAGMATAHVGEGLEAVVTRADRALYRAKERGRNQLQVSETASGFTESHQRPSPM